MLASLKKIRYRCLQIGVDNNSPRKERMRGRILNAIIFIGIAFTFVLMLNAYFGGRYTPASIQAFRVIFLILGLWVHQQFGLKSAAILLLGALTISVAFFVLFVPYATYNIYLLFLEQLILFYFFYSDKILRNALFVFLLLFSTWVGYEEATLPAQAPLLLPLNSIINSIFTFLFLSLFIDGESHYQGLLEQTNKELEQKQEEIAAMLDNERQRHKELEELHATLKRTQQALEKATQRDTLRETAGSFMHGINNPLNFITSGADVLRSLAEELVDSTNDLFIGTEQNNSQVATRMALVEFKEKVVDGELLADIASISEAIDKGSHKISHILSLFRRITTTGPPLIQEVDLAAILRIALTSAQEYVDKPDVVFEILDHSGGILAKADVAMLKEIFYHLLINALDAQEQGSIEIKLEYEESQKTLMVTVKDQGCGIPDDALNQILNPFFSTKAQAGLGLNVAQALLEVNHGKLTYTSQEGVGTSMTVSLPIAGTTGLKRTSK